MGSPRSPRRDARGSDWAVLRIRNPLRLALRPRTDADVRALGSIPARDARPPAARPRPATGRGLPHEARGLRPDTHTPAFMPTERRSPLVAPLRFWKPGSRDPRSVEEADAEEAMKRLRVNPTDLDALEVVGAYLLARGQAEKALEFLHRVTLANPQQPGIWRLKAQAFEAVGDTKNANACRRRDANLRA